MAEIYIYNQKHVKIYFDVVVVIHEFIRLTYVRAYKKYREREGHLENSVSMYV